MTHIRMILKHLCLSGMLDIIATNQRVVAAKRQQRGLVAVTIREALFCSIHLLYEGLISVLSTESSGIYTESIRSN